MHLFVVLKMKHTTLVLRHSQTLLNYLFTELVNHFKGKQSPFYSQKEKHTHSNKRAAVMFTDRQAFGHTPLFRNTHNMKGGLPIKT